MHFVACKTVREYNKNTVREYNKNREVRKFCLEKKQLQKEAQQREVLVNMEQNKPCEEMPGISYTSDRQATHYQAEPSKANHETRQKKQATAQKAATARKRRTERKRKEISPSKKTTRPTTRHHSSNKNLKKRPSPKLNLH